MARAPYGQVLTHAPHAAHRSSITAATVGDWVISEWENNCSTLAAAPLACASVSGISLGPWQVPARNTPAVRVSTGRSLGCASLKKPSASLLMWSVWPRGVGPEAGTMGGAR